MRGEKKKKKKQQLDVIQVPVKSLGVFQKASVRAEIAPNIYIKLVVFCISKW